MWSQIALAKLYGVKYVAYEAGPETFGPHNIAAKKAATLYWKDPATNLFFPRSIMSVVQDFLASWYSNGGDLINWEVAGVGTFDSQYGTYALTDTYADMQTPKIRGIQELMQTYPWPPDVTAGVPVNSFIQGATQIGHSTSTGPAQYLHPGNTSRYLVNAPPGPDGNYFLAVMYANPDRSNPPAKAQITWRINTSEFSQELPPTPNGESVEAPEIPVRLNAGANGIQFTVEMPGAPANTEAPYKIVGFTFKKTP
jgi:hypothetical protein